MDKIIADNIRRLMDHHKHATPTEAARYMGVSQQQLDRILKGQIPKVDTLENLARGYGLEPYQLLIPGLDPSNPQILRVLNDSEELLYQALKAAQAALTAKSGTQ